MMKTASLIVLGIAIVVVLFFVIDIQAVSLQFVQYLKSVDKFTGSILILIVTTIVTLFLLPSTLLNFAAGFLYGPLLGTVAITIGCVVPAILSFFLGKTLLRNWVEGQINNNPKLKALYVFTSSQDYFVRDFAVAKNSFLIIFLTRLSPVFPFALLNYAFGTFQVDFLTYTLATTLGLIPGNFMYSYLGSQMGDISDALQGGNKNNSTGNESNNVMIYMSIFATLAVIVFVTLVTRRALNEATKQFEQQQQEQQQVQ